jgi:hypothetical protein
VIQNRSETTIPQRCAQAIHGIGSFGRRQFRMQDWGFEECENSLESRLSGLSGLQCLNFGFEDGDSFPKPVGFQLVETSFETA